MATSIRRGEEYHTIGTRPRRSTSLRAPFLASDTAGDGRPRYDGPLAKMDRTEDNAADNLGHQRRKSREGNTRGWDGRGDHGDRDDDDDDVELDELLSGEDDADEETDLTKEHGQQKKRKRRRHSLVDGGPSISKQEKKLADANVVRKLLVNALFMGLWYAFSLSISIYNEWMFSPKHLDFKFPLFTTSMHMLVQFVLGSLVLYLVPKYRPRADGITNPHGKPLMTVRFYLSRIGPCGAATGLDIGLGNTSLKFITLTFFTMCKSSALAFVLLFAFLFRLETPSLRLVLIILTMTVGVVMMVAGEAAFDALGFVLIISSAFFSGFRWALTQILLLRNPATANPFSTIFFLTPVMFLTLALLALIIEGLPALGVGLARLAAARGALAGTAMLLFPGVLAFCMTAAEFALLQRTSVVTLSIAGVFKEVLTISAAAAVFHDPLTPINVSGLVVTLASIAGYNYIKVTKMRADARDRLLREDGGVDDVVVAEPRPLFDEEAAHMHTTDLVREAVRSSLTLSGPTAKDRAGDSRDRQSPTKRPGDLE